MLKPQSGIFEYVTDIYTIHDFLMGDNLCNFNFTAQRYLPRVHK